LIVTPLERLLFCV